jgi:hypothetical protein
VRRLTRAFAAIYTMRAKIEKTDGAVAATIIVAFAAAFFLGPYSSNPHLTFASCLYALSGGLSIVFRQRMVRVINAIDGRNHTQFLPVVWGIAVLFVGVFMLLISFNIMAANNSFNRTPPRALASLGPCGGAG